MERVLLEEIGTQKSWIIIDIWNVISELSIVQFYEEILYLNTVKIKNEWINISFFE